MLLSHDFIKFGIDISFRTCQIKLFNLEITSAYFIWLWLIICLNELLVDISIVHQ